MNAQLAVGHVLDDEEPVPPCEIGHGRTPLGRERDACRVLVVRDRVEELRAEAARELGLERRRVESVVVDGDPGHVGLERADGHDRAEVRRRLDRDDVARVEEGLAEQLQRLDPAARDHQVAVAGPPALEPL